MRLGPRTFLKACGFMLLPVAIALPALSWAKFGPCGPSTGWSLTFFALISFYCEVHAFNIFRTNFSSQRDLFWWLKFPCGLLSVCIFFLSGIIFLFMALPALLFGDLPNLFAKLHGS
jgi:hypothetical protein